MCRDNRWAEQCLEHLEDWGLDSAISSHQAAGIESEGKLALKNEKDSWLFKYECIRQLRPGTAAYRLTELLSSNWSPGDDAPWLVFTERVTAAVGEILRSHQVNYVDATGNAWIRRPGLFVWVEGKRAASRPTPSPKRTTPTALQLIFLLLKSTDWSDATYRKLAERTGLALGTVGWIMNNLAQAGHVLQENGGRSLRHPMDLLTLWEQQWHERLRPRLGSTLCMGKPDPGFEALLKICESEQKWLVGGELAATRAVKGIEPTTATVHVPPADVRKCMQRLRLMPHPEGNICIMETFGSENAWQGAEQGAPNMPMPTLADPILIRAELLGSRDKRLHTLADQLLESFIEPRWET